MPESVQIMQHQVNVAGNTDRQFENSTLQTVPSLAVQNILKTNSLAKRQSKKVNNLTALLATKPIVKKLKTYGSEIRLSRKISKVQNDGGSLVFTCLGIIIGIILIATLIKKVANNDWHAVVFVSFIFISMFIIMLLVQAGGTDIN